MIITEGVLDTTTFEIRDYRTFGDWARARIFSRRSSGFGVAVLQRVGNAWTLEGVGDEVERAWLEERNAPSALIDFLGGHVI